MTRKKKGLEDEIELCSTKLSRAEQLIGGLGGEKARWTDLQIQLQNLLSNIIGKFQKEPIVKTPRTHRYFFTLWVWNTKN